MVRVSSFVVRPALASALVLSAVFAMSSSAVAFATPSNAAALAMPSSAAAFASSPSAATFVRESSGAGEAVPKRPTAREQLEYATRLKRDARTDDATVRAAARASAVQAYRAVRELFPAEAAAASEAAFRAGELLRADGDTAAALGEFRWAREHGTGTPFRVRAQLEIGHVERRARHFQDALTAYESVQTDAAATTGQKDDATLWAGSVYAELERFDDARRAWTRVAEQAEDPLDRVRAYDQLALAAVTRGELEGAAGILERCREALADTSAEETKLGERVRVAISDMRAHDVLQRAVAKRAREQDSSAKKVTKS